MAYISAERTREIAKELKAAFPGYKFSVRNDNHSSVRVSIMSAPLRFNALVIDPDVVRDREAYNANHNINTYYLDSYENADVLKRMFAIINKGNHDNSDPQADYFDVGFYTDLQVGKWDKPFTYTGA